MNSLYDYILETQNSSSQSFDNVYIDVELEASKSDEPKHIYQSIVKNLYKNEGSSIDSISIDTSEPTSSKDITSNTSDLMFEETNQDELFEDIFYGPPTLEQHELALSFNEMETKERWVLFLELFEEIWHIRSNSITTKISKQSILNDIKIIHDILGGRKRFFVVGQGIFKLPPFTYFFVKEELYHFSICSSIRETVSVDYYRSDVNVLSLSDKVAHAVLLDVNAPLIEDQGLRFVLLGQFDNPAMNQSLSNPSNSALLQSWVHEIPVRVVRAYNCHSRFSPLWGYRYDGLYRIIDVFSDTNSDGIKIWVFIFSACNDKMIPTPSMYTKDLEDKILKIKERNFLMRISYQLQTRLKIQQSIPLKRSEYIKQIDVVYNQKKLFTIGITHLLKHRPGDKYPSVLNFYCIYKFIVKICSEKGFAKDWLSNESMKYEKCEGAEALCNFEGNDVVFWAAGGFLPMMLVIQKIDNKKLTLHDLEEELDDNNVEKYCERVESIPINREMAKISARPFFPQSQSDCIWTYICLKAPFPDSWDPRKDISAGAEKHPIPVVNTIDDEMPPTGFSYVVSNIFLSRLPKIEFEAVCSGCLPNGVLNNEHSDDITIRGFCQALINRKTGLVYCKGVNKMYSTSMKIHAACSDNCLCPPNCTNRLKEGVQVPVKLIKTALLGWELHTQVFIPKGTYIMQYVGEGISRSELIAREHKYDKMGLFNYCMEAVEMEKDVDDWLMPCIDSMFIGNIARFLNHSCEPNVQVVTVWKGEDFPSIAVYSLCDIPAGDALTYCYGSAYKSIPCLCCSIHCKGYIGIN